MHRKCGSLALAMLCVCCVLAKEITDFDALSTQPTRCTYQYAYEMYGAHCAGLRLPKIPNLKSGIEILDFSDNKLQELHTETLSSYTSLKYLYLAENQIYAIAEDAFASQNNLQTLDLSKNVILNLPDSIFQLPYLQKLYLSGNPIIHMSLNDLAANKQIKAPLQLLDISDCKIKVLPDWGLLPQLVLYNISHNSLVSLEAKHFAVMCNLVKVDLTKSIDDIRLCDMRAAITWFQDKNIYFQLDDYSKLNTREFEKCPAPDVTQALNATHQRCLNQYINQDRMKSPSRRTWLTISGGLVGFLVGFILLLYLIHRHNVAKTKNSAHKLKNPKSASEGDTHATAVLLNDVS